MYVHICNWDIVIVLDKRSAFFSAYGDATERDRRDGRPAPYFEAGISSVRSTRCPFPGDSAELDVRGECPAQDRLLVTLVQLARVQSARLARLEIAAALRRAAPSSTVADGGLIMELTERLTFDSISNCLAT